MRTGLTSILLILVCFLSNSSLSSKNLKTGNGYAYTDFRDALSASENGDTIFVYPGSYKGNFLIDKSVTIIGKDSPVFDGENNGTVITIEAPGVAILDVIIKNSGKLLDREDAGILVKTDNVNIQRNKLISVLFGIYFRQADNGRIKDNLIEGKKNLDVPRRGDLFRAWYCKGLLIENNTLSYGRDFIIWFSHGITIKKNKIKGARYGLHFMYSADSRILQNSVTYSSVGMYLMYSKNLTIEKNLIAYNRGASGFGIGLKDLDNTELRENVIADNRVGIFIDNSPRNYDTYMKYTGNVIAYNETGVNVLSSLHNSKFKKNSFIENYQQAVLTRGQEAKNDYWEQNFWSNYSGYDEDKDGSGDIPYGQDQVFENLIEEKPNLKILLYSPAVSTLSYAADAFPVLKPEPVLIDKAPSIHSILPSGIIQIKNGGSIKFLSFALVLLLMSAGSLVLFRFKNSIVNKRNGSHR